MTRHDLVSNADIRALRAVAFQARDWAQVGLCDLALGQYDLLDLERADCVSAAEAQGYDGDPDDYRLTEADVESIRRTLGRGFAAEEVAHLGVLNTPDDDVTPEWARAECARAIAEARK